MTETLNIKVLCFLASSHLSVCPYCTWFLFQPAVFPTGPCHFFSSERMAPSLSSDGHHLKR